jgi:hypothetical protein
MEYLWNCSPEGMQNFILSQANRAANCKKEIERLIAEMREADALAEFGRLMKENREELFRMNPRQAVLTFERPEAVRKPVRRSA